jgi:peptide/nickel transport system substrate-binding protein
MKKLMTVLGLVIVLSMLLAACGQATQAPAQPPAETAAPVATEAPAATEVPASTMKYADEVDFSAIPDCAAAIAQLSAGAINMYPVTCDKAEDFATVKNDPNLKYVIMSGSSDQLMVNTAACKDTNVLNPFADQQMREATNWMIDRDYIAQEILGGLADPMYTVLDTFASDYARYAAAIGTVIAKYGYNLDKAQQVVDERMTALGATKGADGKWQYKGKPVVIIGLIRTEDTRKNIGDYFANQLEKVGFTVDRQYKVRKEASPIWNNPVWDTCAFNYYTAGWIQTAIPRDEGGNFAGLNDKMAGWSDGFVNYTPSPEYLDVLTKLFTNNFASMEERDALFNKAIPMHMTESWQGSMAVDINAFSPMTKDISVASDLVAGVAGSTFWPYTLMKDGGGTVKIAQSGVMVEPWNPVSGSNWIDDTMVQRGASDWGVMYDPYTGLALPERIESGSVQAVTGTPIVKTLDWVGLEFVPEIKVPGECWADWDAVNQKWITVAEKFPDGATSKTAVTVNYPASLYDTLWQDGSKFSVADVVEHMILTFDLGKKESKDFNVDYQPGLDAFLSHFKGVCITSTNPLTIVTYDDAFNLDAENTVGSSTWYPADQLSGTVYQFGTAAWHNLVPALLAEADGKIYMSQTTSAEKKVDRTSLIAGATLDIQKQYLDKAATDKYIPYANVLGQYVTADEAAARYANLQKFYADHGHLFIGTGPFYVDKAFPVEGTIVLKRFADFADPLDRWSGFAAPKIAVAAVDGPATVTAGQPATFNVTITYNDQPYPQADLSAVSYIVKDANGNIALSGPATITGDGMATVDLTADQTSKLVAGSNVLTVAIASKVVALPTFAKYEFVTTAP